MLPHEVLASIHKFSKQLFEFLFTGDADELAKWWRDAQDINDEWYRTNPVIESTGPLCRVPVGIHGDDAGVHGRQQVLVLSWGSVVKPLPTFDSRIIFTMLRVADIIKMDTMDKIFEVLQWSLNALSDGHYPLEDHERIPFSKTHHPHRYKMAGKPLAEGMVGLWAEMRGDWKFLKEALHLAQHYGRNDYICHLCDVLKFSDDVECRFNNFQQTAGHRSRHYTQNDIIRLLHAESPLLRIRGFNFSKVFFDILHCLDLGVYQVFIPTVLYLLTRNSNVFKASSVDGRYRKAYKHYRHWCRGKRDVTMIRSTFTKNTWRNTIRFPRISQLQAKGAALRSMAYWLDEVLSDYAAKTDDKRVHLQSYALQHFVQADRVTRRAGRHFTKNESKEFTRHLEAALVACNALAADAHNRNEKLFKILPKHHAMTHYYGSRINPRRVACNLDEDMVGRMKIIYCSCHGRTAPKRGLQRYHSIVSIRWWRKCLQLRNIPTK